MTGLRKMKISIGAMPLIWLLTSSLALSAQPTAKNPREAYYRCKGANGQSYFGSAMPVECQGRDTDVLNQRGMVVRVIEGAGTREDRIAREKVESAQRKDREDQVQRDKVLIETYLSVDEIERLRDQRLDLLTAQLRVAEQHIGTLQERLLRLREQTARFKPYTDKPNAPPVPDHIAEDLIGTVKSVAVDQQTIAIKREEQATLTSNFDRDIKRFKELKGIK
jgi:hypothetical protein